MTKFILNTYFFSILVALLFATLFFFGHLEEYEVKTLDTRFKLRGSQNRNNPVFIVLITDDCFEKFGPFPWPREYYAKAIKILSKNRVASIGFDIVFSDENYADPEDDKKLVDASKKAGNIFYPLVFRDILEMGEDTSDFIKKTAILKPFETLAQAAKGFGFIDVKFQEINPDGVIRRVAIARKLDKESPTSSLGLIMAEDLSQKKIKFNLLNDKIEGIQFNNTPIPLYPVGKKGDETLTYYINFEAGDNFDHVPFSSLISNEISENDLKHLQGKAVLIGTSATSLADFYLTPFGLRPGVEIHGNIIKNIVNKNLLARQKRLETLIIIFFTAIFTAYVTKRFLFFKNTLIILFFSTLFLVGSFISFSNFNYIVDIIPIFLTVITCFIINNFFMMIMRIKISRDNLAKKVIELQGLHDIGQLMSSTFSVDIFFKQLVITLRNLFKIKKCSVLLYNKDENTLVMRAATGFQQNPLDEKNNKSISTEKVVLSTQGSVSSYVIEHKKPVLVEDIHSDPRFDVPQKNNGKYKSSSFISAPILHDKEVIGIINLTDKEDNQKFSLDDINLISTFTFQVAIGVEKIKFLDRMVEQERIEQELKVGKDMQFSLLPSNIPEHPDIEIYANLEPAKEIGGDLYHFVNIDENNMGFIVGDVAGKGVQAGLFMAMSSVILKDKRMPSPASILYYTNKSLIEYFEEATPSYLTAIYLMYDKSKKIIKMAKAGHEPPIFIDGETNEIQYIEDDVGGLPLGMFFFPDTKYEEKTFHVKKGDTFILYTDGFPEATNPNDEIMGREEFVQSINDAPKDTLENMGEYLYKKAIEYTGEADRFDDMTLMILRIK